MSCIRISQLTKGEKSRVWFGKKNSKELPLSRLYGFCQVLSQCLVHLDYKLLKERSLYKMVLEQCGFQYMGSRTL